MQFQVTDILFDDKFIVDPDDYIGTFWEADDADDLVDELICAAGVAVKAIDYRTVLN